MRGALILMLAGCVSEEKDPPDVSNLDDTDTIAETDETDTDSIVDTETDPLPSSSVLDASGPIICSDPGDRGTLGFYARKTATVTAPVYPHLEGGNSAIGDLNGDGLPDVVVVSQTELILFLQTRQSGDLEPTIILTEPWVSEVRGLFGATLVDYDADGDLDIMLTGRGVPSRMLRNSGVGTFTDVTTSLGLGGYETHHSTGASFHDLDGDGDLDLFIGGHGFVDESRLNSGEMEDADDDRLYIWDSGVYVDVSDRIPAQAHTGYAFLGGWFDADGDGDDDLYIVDDFGASQEPCRLLINDGGSFTMDDNVHGIDASISGMGLAIGDVDGDGVEDIAVPAWNRNALYLRAGGAAGVWFDVAQSRGFWPGDQQTVGWGSEFLDVENDGLLDLTTAYGYLETHFGDDNYRLQPDAMYVQGSDGILRDFAARGGFDDDAPNRSITAGDITRDGWLDFVKVGLDGVVRFYFSRCGEEAWLSVDLRQGGPNNHAVGATVRLYDGDRQWMRRVRAGGTGYGGGQPPELHFGLGEDVLSIDRMVVEWPDGTREEWTEIAPRQHLSITRPY